MTTEKKIIDLALKLNQLESVKVLQVPFEVVRPIVNVIHRYGKIVYRDTDRDLREHIYAGTLIETIAQKEIFEKDSEQGILIEALAKVAANYNYIQITTI